MTKIDIFSGFLGAGKTTLIKKLIQEVYTGQKIVLIENEFGEIGIDGGFLQEAGIQITEMNSGCICCSLVGDFGKALRQVIDQYHPDRILIEPSGVGKLSDVIRAVEGVEKDIPEAEMGSFVTVADAGKCRMYVKNFGEFFLNQIEYAGTILLSRTQGMSQEKLEAVVALLREYNAKARIITTPWDEISGETILAAMQDDHDLAADMLATVLAEHHDDNTFMVVAVPMSSLFYILDGKPISDNNDATIMATARWYLDEMKRNLDDAIEAGLTEAQKQIQANIDSFKFVTSDLSCANIASGILYLPIEFTYPDAAANANNNYTG